MIKLWVSFFLFNQVGFARDSEFPQVIKGSVGQMPSVSEEGEKGELCDFIREYEKVSGIKIDFKVRPFIRSIDSVVKGIVDFHFPLIEPKNVENLPYSFSTVTLDKVKFLLFSNANNPLTPDQLEGKSLETDVTHVNLFPHEISPSACVLCSLKKVDKGRLDGFIYADGVAERLIEKEGFRNIHRTLYDSYNIKFVIPKGTRGSPVDRFLTKYSEILKNNGTWERYYTDINNKALQQ